MKKYIDALAIVLKSNRVRYGLTIFFLTVIGIIIGKKLLGYRYAKPSKKDKRDYRIPMIALSSSLPQSFELPLPVIKNQGVVGSCVAHSVSYLSEHLLPKLNDYEKDRVSVGWVYGFRPSGYYQGEGMYPREALKTVQQFGAVRHIDFPYNEEVPKIIRNVNSNIIMLKEKAKSNKIPVYFQLKTNDEIKNCLMKYGPVTVMFPVHAEFESPIDGKIDVRGLKNFRGYHQVSIYGWSGDYWVMVNSWGTGWGNKGTALISMKYPWTEMWGVSNNQEITPPQKKTLLTRILEWLKLK